MKKANSKVTAAEKKAFVDSLVEGWPSPFVSRNATHEFTGGALKGRTTANVESLNPEKRVSGRVLIGRNVAYPTRSYAEWIADHMLKPTDENN